MRKTLRTACLAVGALSLLMAPGAVQDVKERLRQKLKDTAVRGDWVYDDIEAGFAAAKQSGKPLLVVFR